MRLVTSILLVFVSGVLIAAQRPPADGLSYEPTVVELRGTLSIAQEFGPPNFGEDPRRDKKVHVPVLQLAYPVKVRGDARSDINSQSEDNVQRVQLLFPAGASYKKLVNREIIVAGTLFHSHTGHHYTKILMNVTRFYLATSCGEGLRPELMRLQQEAGLTLVEMDVHYNSVDFLRGSFSQKPVEFNGKLAGPGLLTSDGHFVAVRLSRKGPHTFYLGIARSDGSGFREFPDLISPRNFCWSHDNSKLVVSVAGRGQPMGILHILDIGSGMLVEIEANAAVTTQCWSPDGRQVVYWVDSGIRVYSVQEKKSRELSKGRYPTWSPDGQLVAFHDTDGYYAIRPSGADRKLLFKRIGVQSGLLWSPDGRIAAYLCVGGKYPKGTSWGIRLVYQPREVRFRCMSDGSEDSIHWGSDVYYVPDMTWVSRWFARE